MIKQNEFILICSKGLWEGGRAKENYQNHNTVFIKDSQQFHIAWHSNRACTSLLPVVDPEQWKSTQ